MECNACGRLFGGITAFDAHQAWVTNPHGSLTLHCQDPAYLLTRDGRPRFHLNAKGKWVDARPNPFG